MEASILSPQYLGLIGKNGAVSKILELKSKCQLVEGSFTILWHNSEFNKQNKAIYKKVIS